MKRLHSEIEQLKSANRDLQFQLVLLYQDNQKHSTAPENKTMYEFDFGSRHCILQLKCERCHQYSPLKVNCVKPDGKLVSGIQLCMRPKRGYPGSNPKLFLRSYNYNFCSENQLQS
ncbi:hypothetical protein WDU94_002816 [Cyamophila willieti]